MTKPATPLLSEPGQTRVGPNARKGVTMRILKAICILVCMLSAGCASNHEGSPNVLSATNAPSQMNSNELAKARAMIAGAMNERARKEFEDRLRGIPPPPSEFPFPNFDTGPHRPLPIHVNFYCINDHYPNYLLCQYDVDEKNYSQSDESKWFKAALKQIRDLGTQKFPPVEWIAVIIINRAECKDVSTIDQAHKVGVIFKASDVFDSSHDLSQLIAHADMNRHPFKLDPQQPTPGEQQRWLIVERHATNNPPTTGSN